MKNKHCIAVSFLCVLKFVNFITTHFTWASIKQEVQFQIRKLELDHMKQTPMYCINEFYCCRNTMAVHTLAQHGISRLLWLWASKRCATFPGIFLWWCNPPFFFLKLVRMWLSAELGDVTLAAAYVAADVAEELGQVSPRSARLWSGLRWLQASLVCVTCGRQKNHQNWRTEIRRLLELISKDTLLLCTFSSGNSTNKWYAVEIAVKYMQHNARERSKAKKDLASLQSALWPTLQWLHRPCFPTHHT